MGNIGSGLDPTKLALGVELSHVNGRVDISLMDIDFVLAKASDGRQLYSGGMYDMGNYSDQMFSRNVDAAYRTKLPLLAVHHFRPEPDLYQASTPDKDWQWKAWVHAMRNRPPMKAYHGIVLKLTDTGGESNATLHRKLENFYAWMLKDENFGTVPVYFMLPIKMIEDSVQLTNFLASKGSDKNLILVQNMVGGKINTTWAELREKHIPAQEWKIPTPGHATWQMVSWATGFHNLEGTLAAPPALLFANTNPERLHDRLKYLPPIIDETPVYINDTEDLRLRAEPSRTGVVLGSLRKGTEVKVMSTLPLKDEKDGFVYTWGKVSVDGKEGWVALTKVFTHNFMRKK